MKDANARERGARDFDTNLVVEAGAGSGKTSLLVERVLCQMLARGLEVDQFAAITFTEKAAAEMRKRLASALAELAKLARERTPPEQVGEKTEAQRAYRWLVREHAAESIAETAKRRLADLVGAEISTIHGFCAGLLRRHPIEAGVDPGFAVDTGLGFDELQRELWRDFLAGADGPGGARGDLWHRVLADLDLAELEELGRACASFRLGGEDTPLALPPSREWLRARAIELLGEVEACVPSAPANGPESWLEAARVPLAALRDLGPAAMRVELDRARCKDGRGKDRCLLEKTPPTSKKHPIAESLARDVYRELRELRLVDDALLADALELVRPFARAVKAQARTRGVLPFDALLVLARELLIAHPAVRRKLCERYRALFLDEFQDTDPLQYEIILLLAEIPSEVPAYDAFAAELARGKLFIVGDPKQAIYRFRGADVSAYQRAVARVVEQGGEVLELITCFRSVPELLAPLHRIFPEILSSDDPELAYAYSGYSGLVSGRPPVNQTRVEVWTVTSDGSRAEDARRTEADRIAGWVATEIAARRLAPKQIALLFRALGDVHRYASALQERGVPCLVGRSEDLASEPAGQQVRALLGALANPADAPAVLGVLRSALGAVPDAELARWASRFELRGGERERCWSYPDVSPPSDEFPDLARAFGLLVSLRERARGSAPAALLAALLDETPLLEIHALSRDGERRVADLLFLIERLVSESQAKPGCDLSDLVRALDGEERRPPLSDSEEAPDRVRLMSIHAAKGLEFPVVILPDLSRGSGGGRRPKIEVERLRDPPALAVSTRAGNSASWIERARAEVAHDEAEAGRLFYVACTRAQERLVFVHAPRKSVSEGDSQLRFLSGWGYTKEGRDADEALPLAPDVDGRKLTESTDARLAPAPPRAAPTQDPVARASRAAAHARASARPLFASPSGLREDADSRARATDLEPVVEAPRDTPDRSSARALGTLLHDALERWDFCDAGALVALVESAARRIAAEASLSAEKLAGEARALAETLLASELPAHLASVDVLGRELPVLFRDPDGTAWSGTIDLLYRDADGRLVIADYKTDRAPDELARAHYRAQLSSYARGVARVFPGEAPPALELVWLRTGLRERLRLESDP